MWTSALVASLHYLGLGIGLGSVYARARAFRALEQQPQAIKTVLLADNFWGISALLMLSSGLLRAFGGLEKGSTFYLQSPFFHVKMGLFLLILLLELAPMITLMRWRLQAAQRPAAQAFELRLAQRFARFSYLELGLFLAMLASATLMARVHI